MEYRLTLDPNVIRLTDVEGNVTFIPINNLANIDSRVYQAWLTIEGNEPEPAE